VAPVRGIVSTGYILALLVGLTVLAVAGFHLLMDAGSLRVHAVTVEAVEAVAGPGSVTLSVLVENHGSEPVVIASIVLTDGYTTLVFGDRGVEDGLTGYLDFFEPVEVAPGSAKLIGAFHGVPEEYSIGEGAVVIVRYVFPGWDEPYEAADTVKVRVSG